MTVHVNIRPTLSQRHYTDNLVITPKPIKNSILFLRKNCPCSFAVSPRNIWSFDKRYEHTYADPPENGPLASRLSQSFEVIGNDNDRLATYNFLLHSNHGQPCIISVINGNFGWKSQWFSSPCWGGSLRNFVLRSSKNMVMLLLDSIITRSSADADKPAQRV